MTLPPVFPVLLLGISLVAGPAHASVEAVRQLEARLEAGQWLGPEATKASREAVERTRAEFGEGSPEAIAGLVTAGRLHFERADYPRARARWEQAEREAGPRVRADLRLRIQVSLAELETELARFAAADTRLAAARELLPEVAPPAAGEVALVAGRLALARNDMPTAMAELQAALTGFREHYGPDHPRTADALSALGMFHRTTGDWDRMLEAYQQVWDIREAALPEDHPDRVLTLEQRGYHEVNVNADLAEGRRYYEAAVEQTQAALGARHPEVGRALYGLAYILYFVGEHQRSEELLVPALEIWRETLGERHPRVADVLKFQAITARKETPPNLERSRQLFEENLAIWREAVGDQHSQVAVAEVNLAEICNEQGDYDAAMGHAERAYAIWVEAMGDHHPFVGWCHNIMAHSLTGTGRYEEAWTHYDRAIGIFSAMMAPYHHELTEHLQDFSISLLLGGDIERAVETSRQAASNARELLRISQSTMSERELLSYAAQRKSHDGLDVLLSAASHPDAGPTHREAALDALIRGRVFALDEIAFRNRSMDPSDPATRDLLRQLTELRNQLSGMVVAGPQRDPATFQADFRALRDRIEELERELAHRDPEIRRRRARDTIGYEEVRVGLAPGQAMVAYSRHVQWNASPSEQEAVYTAFVLRPGQPLRVHLLGSAGEIESLVETWHAGLRQRPSPLGRRASREQRHRDAGWRLRARIWDPLLNDLKGVDTVFLVPDGGLHMVNLYALPADNGGYLVDQDRYVHTLSAERDLITLQERTGAGRGLLALGGVQYDILPSGQPVETTAARGDGRRGGGTFFGERLQREDFRSMVFAPLPATGSEVDALQALWEAHGDDDAILLREAAASEAAFKREAPGRRVVHVATHAFFLGVSETPGENPLLVSGLALAGANHRERTAASQEEDGILTAEEIATLDLSGTEWAVLSACDSGVGEIVLDQGVTGLRRAFQTSGVGTLIMSLWPVDDRATRAWMEALYSARLEDDASTVEAVRHATRAVLEGRRKAGSDTHPFTWGAFVAAGDWR